MYLYLIFSLTLDLNSSWCSKAKKAIDVANFYNNVESIWEGLVKKNRCYKLDSNAEFTVEAGAADKVGKSKAMK